MGRGMGSSGPYGLAHDEDEDEGEEDEEVEIGHADAAPGRAATAAAASVAQQAGWSPPPGTNCLFRGLRLKVGLNGREARAWHHDFTVDYMGIAFVESCVKIAHGVLRIPCIYRT